MVGRIRKVEVRGSMRVGSGSTLRSRHPILFECEIPLWSAHEDEIDVSCNAQVSRKAAKTAKSGADVRARMPSGKELAPTLSSISATS